LPRTQPDGAVYGRKRFKSSKTLELAGDSQNTILPSSKVKVAPSPHPMGRGKRPGRWARSSVRHRPSQKLDSLAPSDGERGAATVSYCIGCDTAEQNACAAISFYFFLVALDGAREGFSSFSAALGGAANGFSSLSLSEVKKPGGAVELSWRMTSSVRSFWPFV